MRVLICGGAGYIGSRVTQNLLVAKHNITIVDRADWGLIGLAAYLDDVNCNLIIEDINDIKLHTKDYDLIVHLAAIVGEGACLSARKEIVYQSNVESTKRLLDLDIPLIFISTCSNYGKNDTIADEDTPLNPLSLYAESKIESEELVKKERGLILRFGTICGASPRMRYDLLINDMARAAVFNQDFSIFAPTTWRPYLHICEAANAIKRCIYELEHTGFSEFNSKIYNVLSENSTKEMLVPLIKDKFPNFKIELINKGDTRDYRVTAKKISEELDFTPKRGIKEAFKEVVDLATGDMKR